MTTPIIKYKSTGGPVTLQAKAGFAQGGSYDYYLWEADELTHVKDEPGQFSGKPKDHKLSGSHDENDKRFVEFDCSVAMIPPEKRFQVTVEIFQDGQKIGSVTGPDKAPGTAEDGFEDVDVYFQVVKS